MAKLDEITELLTEELEGFRKSIAQLNLISGELKSSEVVKDIYTIKQQLSELRKNQEALFQKHRSDFREINSVLASAKLAPKWLLALFCIAATLTILSLGYFGYHFIQLEDSKAEAFKNGKEQILLDLKEYFDEHPEAYKGFQAWSKKQERVPNQK